MNAVIPAADALVPPLATGRTPVTPDVNGKPVQLVSVPLVGVPRIGVTSVGLVLRTLLPEPVLVVTPVPPFATGKVPVTPVVSGKPVAFVSVPLDGVPNAPPGATKSVPAVAAVIAVVPVPFKTPVSVVAPVPPDVTANVADKPAAVPVVFWFNVGNVQLARFPLVGVPNIGVTNVGLVERTTLPVPVLVVTPVPPLATGNVPVTPVVRGRPVAFVNVPEDGVPNAPPGVSISAANAVKNTVAEPDKLNNDPVLD